MIIYNLYNLSIITILTFLIFYRPLIMKMTMKKVQMMTVLVRLDDYFYSFDDKIQKIVFK